MKKDQPLETEVKNGRLVISIGIEALRRAAMFSPDDRLCWMDDKAETIRFMSFAIEDPKVFAEDVALAMETEICAGGDGTTYLHRFLDDSMVRAIEEGSAAVAEEPTECKEG